MDTKAILAANARDPRLDFFLGIANWSIFVDHIPHNAVNLVTVRNYGFSGAADIFIFISGYTAAIVFAKMMLERGFIVGATRLFKRVWQLYVAYVLLFVIYIVTISDVAVRYGVPDIIYEFNVAGLAEYPIRTLAHGLLLQSRPLNLDILQLYIILMALFAPVLWIMLRKPDLTIAASLALYLAARQIEWSLPSFPGGYLYFNPFCWQLLFLSGAWLALGGARESRSILELPILRYFGIAYLGFALVMTLAGRFPELGRMFPTWLFDAFNPNDRTNLAPYRFLHFIVLARAGVADLQAGHQMRPTIGRGFLRRGVSLIRRPFRADDQFGFAAGADFRQRNRHRDHDPRRLLYLLVQATGQPASHRTHRCSARSDSTEIEPRGGPGWRGLVI
jgi:hypothetical protein